MTAPRSHGCADPRLCMDCRRERMRGRPVPGEDATQVADAPMPGAVVELGDVDDAHLLDQDLQRTLGLLRYVAFTWEDAVAMYRAATRNRRAGRLAADVSVRAAEALSEAFAVDPSLRPEHTNAIPTGRTNGDHGVNSTFVELTTGRQPGRPRDPD